MLFYLNFQEKKIVSFFEGFTQIKIQKKAYTSLFAFFGESFLSQLDNSLRSNGIDGLLSTNHFLLQNTTSRYHLIESVSVSFLSDFISKNQIDPDIVSKVPITFSESHTMLFKSFALINFLKKAYLLDSPNSVYFSFESFFHHFTNFVDSDSIKNDLLSFNRESISFYDKNDQYTAFISGYSASFSFDEALSGFIELYDFLINNVNFESTLYPALLSQKENLINKVSDRLSKMKQIIDIANTYKTTLK